MRESSCSLTVPERPAGPTNVCASDEGNELIKLAEIGNPNRKDYFKSEREAAKRGPLDPLDV